MCKYTYVINAARNTGRFIRILWQCYFSEQTKQATIDCSWSLPYPGYYTIYSQRPAHWLKLSSVTNPCGQNWKVKAWKEDWVAQTPWISSTSGLRPSRRRRDSQKNRTQTAIRTETVDWPGRRRSDGGEKKRWNCFKQQQELSTVVDLSVWWLHFMWRQSGFNTAILMMFSTECHMAGCSLTLFNKLLVGPHSLVLNMAIFWSFLLLYFFPLK